MHHLWVAMINFVRVWIIASFIFLFTEVRTFVRTYRDYIIADIQQGCDKKQPKNIKISTVRGVYTGIQSHPFRQRKTCPKKQDRLIRKPSFSSVYPNISELHIMSCSHSLLDHQKITLLMILVIICRTHPRIKRIKYFRPYFLQAAVPEPIHGDPAFFFFCVIKYI